MNKRIIVAEDSREQRESLVETLEKGLPGVTIDQTDGGTGLVNMALANNYDAIVTDNDMGYDKSGIQATKEIRAQGINTPIYLHSGYSVSERELKELEAIGVTKYFRKGFMGDVIVRQENGERTIMSSKELLLKELQKMYAGKEK